MTGQVDGPGHRFDEVEALVVGEDRALPRRARHHQALGAGGGQMTGDGHGARRGRASRRR